ncbi:MAG TPA: nucleotide exchange factor GrpE [Candidatus Eisenbacteria bacterium]|jgi:molecular chaperone GrpE|nr:nucleotide exchange factor GrpE [Candidatus Eisenbacteria bacterium]
MSQEERWENEGGHEAETNEPAAEEAGDGAAEFRDKWLRCEAEMANYRRRVARDLEDVERRARERVLSEVVSLADDLERALDAAEQGEHGGPIVAGVRLVHDRVRDILKNHGVEVVDPAGKPFDPHVAEAVLEVEAPGKVPGTVVSVVEKGYRRGERLLRPAKVTVARAADKDR